MFKLVLQSIHIYFKCFKDWDKTSMKYADILIAEMEKLWKGMRMN